MIKKIFIVLAIIGGINKDMAYKTHDWISRSSALNTEEMKHNADNVITMLQNESEQNWSLESICALLGNMQAESGINPERTEDSGGGGYGLIQWTPVSALQNVCSAMGLSPYTSGDVQVQCIEGELLGVVSVWYTSSGFINNYRDSGTTDEMIGTTGLEFIENSREFSLDDLTLLYMVGRERPAFSPEINHIGTRQENARNWYEYITGGEYVDPGGNTTESNARIKCIIPLLRAKRII